MLQHTSERHTCTLVYHLRYCDWQQKGIRHVKCHTLFPKISQKITFGSLRDLTALVYLTEFLKSVELNPKLKAVVVLAVLVAVAAVAFTPLNVHLGTDLDTRQFRYKNSNLATGLEQYWYWLIKYWAIL